MVRLAVYPHVLARVAATNATSYSQVGLSRSRLVDDGAVSGDEGHGLLVGYSLAAGMLSTTRVGAIIPDLWESSRSVLRTIRVRWLVPVAFVLPAP